MKPQRLPGLDQPRPRTPRAPSDRQRLGASEVQRLEPVPAPGDEPAGGAR